MVEIDQFTIERAKSGDKKAFQKLYDFYADYVWVQVYRTVNGSKDDAEELFQQIFIRIYKKLGLYSFKSSFSTWIYRLAYNVMMDFFRKRKTFWERFLPFNEEQLGKEEEEFSAEIDQVLATLPADERYLLTAREVEGLSFDELAEITGKSAGSLRTTIHRIKTRLREEYDYE